MSGSTKTTQQQTQNASSSNAIDPAQLAMLTANYRGAQDRAGSLTPYTGQTVAGFNPAQLQAQGVLTGIGNDSRGQSAISDALGAAQGVLGNPVNPMVSATPVSSAPVAAGMLAGTDLSPYLNPYTGDVINASIAQNEQARQMAQVADAQAATAAGAFGGSRSGVSAALTNQLYDQNDQSNIAGLNSRNFTQAQDAATGDLTRRLSADQGNQSSGLNAAEFNAGQGLTAEQDSFNNALASAGLTLNAAGQIVALNQAGLQDATARAGLLSSVGDAQHNQDQAALTAAYNNYLQGQQLTVQQQQLLNSALGIIPLQQTTTSSGSGNGTTDAVKSPGLTDILSAVGSLVPK